MTRVDKSGSEYGHPVVKKETKVDPKKLERRTVTSSLPPMSERQPDERDPIWQILKAGALYFAIVFGAGFVFGTIRTIWIW